MASLVENSIIERKNVRDRDNYIDTFGSTAMPQQNLGPNSEPSSGEPSNWVRKFISGISPGGHVLDLAAGQGRHTRFALELGYKVTAVDRTLVGLADLHGRENLTLLQHDLEQGASFPAAKNSFDAVIVTNYLWRPILPDVVAAVSASGILIYETFGQGQEAYGSPKNPDFLLAPGELCEVVRDQLTIIAYEHFSSQRQRRVISHICAVAHDHPWCHTAPSLEQCN